MINNSIGNLTKYINTAIYFMKSDNRKINLCIKRLTAGSMSKDLLLKGAFQIDQQMSLFIYHHPFVWEIIVNRCHTDKTFLYTNS